MRLIANGSASKEVAVSPCAYRDTLRQVAAYLSRACVTDRVQLEVSQSGISSVMAFSMQNFIRAGVSQILPRIGTRQIGRSVLMQHADEEIAGATFEPSPLVSQSICYLVRILQFVKRPHVLLSPPALGQPSAPRSRPP